MEGRHKAFLRNTSNKSATGRHMINLPNDIWEKMGWKVNENLQIDTIKVGLHEGLYITREGE